MSSPQLCDTYLYQPQASGGAISYPLIVSIAFHTLIGVLLYTLFPAQLESQLTAPAKMISVILSPAIPEVKKPKPIPRKPIAKPETVTKKTIVSNAESSYTVQKKIIKPIEKQPVKVAVKSGPASKPKPKATPKAAVKPSSPAAAPIVQQATHTPQPTYKPKPKYPSTARRRSIEGTVIFEIFLNNNGSVNKAIITQSSGSGALDSSALKTVKTWRFPANRFNSLSSFKQSIQFKLYN